ncbi:MAG: cyclic pyranopterin monophosphate synthase MoaC [Pirellulaceae bacterium]|nr:cyclic pyranopterin monophosphate synthase MoaC [Pirellulaceae bacterium]
MTNQGSVSSAAEQLTHLDSSGQARMVNVADKPVSLRTATASALCSMNAATAQAIRDNQVAKGDVLSVAKLAAISACKRTSELIPLCHNVGLDGVNVEFQWLSPCQLQITVQSQATARTGVEMEAMVGASVAALTVYDMCKSSDRSLSISQVLLLSKSGGLRGDYRRPPNADST